MSVIQVQSPGLLTTVQDLGREGFGPLGVSPCGAADRIALRLGNRLVENAESAPALEMTLLGGTFVFPQGAAFALTGSDFCATLDGAAVELWASAEAKPGQTLRLGPTRSGARCYLCVQGGIGVKPFLQSASTHLLSRLGGHQGRALRKGDVLQIGPCNAFASKPFRKRKVPATAVDLLSSRKILRVTPGPQTESFPDSSRQRFYAATYRVTEECNRMGLRLDGPAAPAVSAEEMITEGVSLGAIQITAGGLPIILFVEQQTTGGYPKIANVISADLSSVGQLRPRDEIRFEHVDWETARSLLLEQEKFVTSEDIISRETH
jgi:antagonist of KipI